jgi:hypothetical protein
MTGQISQDSQDTMRMKLKFSRYGLLLLLSFFSWVPAGSPGKIYASGILEFLPDSQLQGYSQSPVTFYRITAGGLGAIIALGVVLIFLVAAAIYLLIIYKKRMNDLEQKISSLDVGLKELHLKHQGDLNTMLNHLYELRKRAEPKEPGARASEPDTYVGKKDSSRKAEVSERD